MSNRTLSDIRQHIDQIDIQIHNLLMERAAVVDDIIELKKKSNHTNNGKIVAYHPAREALLLKNILERHQGNLPHSVIIELWRSLLSAFCNMQSSFVIGYIENQENDGDFIETSRFCQPDFLIIAVLDMMSV